MPGLTGARRIRSGLVALALALVLAVATGGCTASRQGPSRAEPGSTVGPIALGVNIAAWDNIYAETGPNAITTLLKSAGLRLIRYPGGSWADQYDWSTDSDTSECTSIVTGSCIGYDPLTFNAISEEARAAGASAFITVNYGSALPAEAAGWVAYVKAMGKSHAVALWEVGNESYSCYETNFHLAGSPTYVKGYFADGPVCPATSVMAASYAVNALPYLEAMKHVRPKARIGVPWAFSGDEARGAGVTDAATWDGTVLRALGGHISFVDAHWYPFDTTTGLTDQQLLDSVGRIPAAAARIRTALHRYSPGATFVVGEMNISERMTPLDFQPVSALFAAATSLEWLVQGAETVDWWDLNNFGSPSTGDYGLVTSGGQEVQPTGSTLPPYYGEELASRLAAPGSVVAPIPTGRSTVLGFESTLGHTRAVLLVNTDPSASSSIASSWFEAGSDVRIETYSAATAETSDPVTSAVGRPDRPVALPALSIVVLSGTSRS